LAEVAQLRGFHGERAAQAGKVRGRKERKMAVGEAAAVVVAVAMEVVVGL
jgi:hypothetical protein